MNRRGVHARGAHAFHHFVKTCLLMGAGPLVRRLEYENAIAAVEYIVIPFKLVAVAPRERVRLEHDESRQAYQALKSLATHKTDRNDARGLVRLARTGFFKSVHVKSLPAHALRSLIIARKKLVGQRATLENQAQTFPFL
jgi:hypothetical protein